MKALGNRKDYARTNKGIRKNLELHNELMRKYMDEGLSEVQASIRAYDELLEQGKFNY